jgi:DNA invertase Pin-like site-specific DNA recombinase
VSAPQDPIADSPAGDPLSNCPREIKATHRAKLAVIYARQSSPQQVKVNTGSTEDQRALSQLPVRWGWPPSRIRVIDDDLGLSGTTADRRSGFQDMLDLIDQGQVGLVLVRDVARWSRDPFVSELFLTKAIRAGVLIYANGRVFDSATEDLAELFGLRIQALLAWFENRSRARMMGAAKAAKIRQGFAVAQPPLGYVRISRGKWAKDPDPEVRASVQRIFDLALESQSIGKIIRYMKEHRLRLPRRLRGELVWERPARSSVANILSNPNYTPHYSYRRRRQVPKPTGGGSRAQLRPEAEWLVFRDHHEGYISTDRWQLIQESLKSRRPQVRPPLGKGAAWLQGLVWCPQCERWMWTSYHRRRGAVRLASYLCRRIDRWGQPAHHLVVTAEIIDTMVATHVLASLEVVDRDAAMGVIEQAQAEHRGIRASHQRLLQRAEAEVQTARQRYLEVGPEYPLVKADLAAAYEDAIRRRDTIQMEITSAGPVEDIPFTLQDGTHLSELTRQIKALWTAPTTTTEDRKQLLRLVLQRVIVMTSTPDDVEVEVVWATGFRERLQVRRRTELDARVRALQQAGKEPGTIADELTAAGVPSATGKPVSREIVKRSLTRVGLNEKAVRHRILARIRELLEQNDRPQILQVLDTEFPLPHSQWNADRLSRAIRRLQQGVRGIDPLPAGLVEKPDMAVVMALVHQWRKEGKAWRVIADDLNARGFRPVRAKKFSLFQVMELARRRTGRAASLKGTVHKTSSTTSEVKKPQPRDRQSRSVPHART